MTTHAATIVLMYFIVPVWFVAGVADWLCHRATDIEHTTGVKESLIHLLMFFEIGLPLTLALLCDINALLIAIGIVAFLAHQATAFWDVRYAVTRRTVAPIEQHVHSFLELLPLMAGAFVVVLHWPQFLALFGLGDEPARLALAWKRPALPTAYVATVLGASLVLEFMPFVDELWRGWRATGGRLVPALSATRR